MWLTEKVAIITGVSKDGQVGQTVAQSFARGGARLAITARSARDLEARAQEVRELGAEVLVLPADLTDEQAVRDLVRLTLEHYGRIDVLVNLAGGLTIHTPLAQTTLDMWTRELNNNLLSAFLCSREVFGQMQTQGGGSIIFFTRAGQPREKMVAYNCAKAGVEALVRTLAYEGRTLNIRANAIGPGIVETRSNIESMKPEDTARWAQREEIAAAVVFLASDAASGITGQVLAVPGRTL
ncbi:MAG TPA: SDR family oxidoreductase [Herpetosiphonaceae bacterium]|nr:SDR family oxidoreductase [Herpetosiphonaceae bacterium]